MGDHETIDVTLEDQVRFNKYVLRAKELAINGEIEEAIRYNKKAYHIAQVDKIAKRIKKLEVCYHKEFFSNVFKMFEWIVFSVMMVCAMNLLCMNRVSYFWNESVHVLLNRRRQ